MASLPNYFRPKASRQGVALFLVLSLMVAFSFALMSMILISGQTRRASANSVHAVKARVLAEGAASIVLADILSQGNAAFYKTYKTQAMHYIQDGDTGVAQAEFKTSSSGIETIASGTYKGLQAKSRVYEVTALGKTPKGGASVKVEARLSQIPILQFGRFIDGNDILSPGSNQTLLGRIHINGNLLIAPGGTLQIQGPATVSGNIQVRNGYAGSRLFLWNAPNTPSKRTEIPLTPSTVTLTSYPTMSGGYRPLYGSAGSLSLPLGGASPYALIELCNGNESEDLEKQKFDCIAKTSASTTSRFIAGVSSQPSWIKGPFVAFDRAMWRWFKYWDFDVAALNASSNKDSLFILADTNALAADRGTLKLPVYNAFRIVNADRFKRDITFSTPNVIYTVGDINTISRDSDTSNYYSLLIACDYAHTLSDGWDGSAFARQRNRVQNFNNLSWGTEPRFKHNDDCNALAGAAYTTVPCYDSVSLTPSGDTRVNAHFISYQNLGLKERWSGYTITMRGSMISLWNPKSKNFAVAGPVITPDGMKVRYYWPPSTRDFGFDQRMTNLEYMPPFTPFLANLTQLNWLEKR